MVGLASIALVALALTFLVIPPALAAHLVIRAQRGGAPLLRWAGVLLMGVWFVLLLLIGRRVMGRPQAPATHDPPDAEADAEALGDASSP